MSTFPEILIPVLEVARQKPSDVVAKYWHDTPIFILPPNLPRTRFTWMPRPGYVLVCLFTSFGRAYPLDPSTLEIDTSFWYENPDAGFWHEAPDMRFHWDPLVSSLTDKPYPHLSVVTDKSPLVFELENPTDDWIYFNVSVHIWEMTEDFYNYIFRPYLLGIFYFFWKLGVEAMARCRPYGEPLNICLTKLLTEEIEKIEKELEERGVVTRVREMPARVKVERVE